MSLSRYIRLTKVNVWGGGARKNSGALHNLHLSAGGNHGKPVSGNHQAHIKLNKSSVEVKENTNQQSDGIYLLQGRVGQGANCENLNAERQQKQKHMSDANKSPKSNNVTTHQVYYTVCHGPFTTFWCKDLYFLCSFQIFLIIAILLKFSQLFYLPNFLKMLF